MIKRGCAVVSLLALCLAAAPAGAEDALLSELRENAKLRAPAEILADLVNGEPETAVIVHLRPTPAAMGLAARSREAGPVPEGFSGPEAATYYNLEDESISAELRATVAEQVARVVDEIGPYGMTVTQRFSYQFGFAARVTPAALARILAAPDVVAVEKDAVLHEHLKQGIPLMNATAARSSYLGAGVSIAICDTGIDTRHPRLGGTGNNADPKFNAKVIGGYDTGDGDDDPRPDSSAGNAHGTACAGIAAGGLGAVGDYAGGVAPSAKLYAIKISEGTGGSAYTSAMIAGWEWCITHRNDSPANPIKVISTSFGGSRFASTCDSGNSGMTTAAANAVAAGITLFVSSGNDGYCDSTAWPACISHVNSVGAVYDASFGTYRPCISAASCAPTKTATTGCASGYYATDATGPDKVTSYSNSAPFLTLYAPSNNAYSTDMSLARQDVRSN
jgi:subtilisin family serine protease